MSASPTVTDDHDSGADSMLPESLLCLLSATLALAQARQELQLNQITSLNTLRLPTRPSFAIPEQDLLSISVALCSSATSIPRFFVTNATNSDLRDDPGPFSPETFELDIKDGQGSWTGIFPNGGIFAIETDDSNESIAFDVGVSASNDPVHKTLTNLPFFGDTTSNQALLLSHVFATYDIPQPTYPNYTLPDANMTQPSLPTNAPNMTLLLAPTSAGLANVPRTGCSLSSQSSKITVGNVANETFWARDETGWRSQWLMGGLTPSTNYTAFVLQDSTKVSGPIYFATKSAAFNCPLVHSLPYCPGVSYAVPLPAPPDNAESYTPANLPSQVSGPLVSYLANFTTVLTTFACGRDWYSPIVGCDDCQREYRKWLCAISFTRCSEPSLDNPNGFTAVPAEPTATGLAASKGGQQQQKVLSALLPRATRDPQRNPSLPALGSPYTMLLPCLEQCNKMDRACPPFVGIKCPTNGFNAAASYGVGYIDSADGDKDGGLTGASQDRYGNVWCQML